ncbi:MAG: hypothetical protein KH230_22655 [Enterocloster asparagiformis]|nr:hypothetical protein [Enterocloster asparagiformis]
MIDYCYPKEKAALHELVKRKEFQAVLKLFETVYSNATDFARLQGRNFKITRASEPRIHYLYRLAAKRLEFTEDVPLYLELSHQFAPKIYGTDGTCAVVVSSICLEALSDPELTAMFGSAISHIQNGHVKYLNMGNLADELFLSVPFVGNAAAMMIKALLVQWHKYAEFTADRGAAVAAGEAQAAFGYLSKSMGASSVVHDWKNGSRPRTVETMSKAERLVFQLLAEDIPVPFGRLRMEKLREWLCSPQCRQISRSLYYGGMGETAAWGGKSALNPADRGKRLYQESAGLFHKNQERAMILLCAAASCEYGPAQDYLARCYINGAHGIEKNDPAGIDLLKKAAGKGCEGALSTLGGLLLKGAGTILPKDENLGRRLIRQSEIIGRRREHNEIQN